MKKLIVILFLLCGTLTAQTVTVTYQNFRANEHGRFIFDVYFYPSQNVTVGNIVLTWETTTGRNLFDMKCDSLNPIMNLPYMNPRLIAGASLIYVAFPLEWQSQGLQLETGGNTFICTLSFDRYYIQYMDLVWFPIWTFVNKMDNTLFNTKLFGAFYGEPLIN